MQTPHVCSECGAVILPDAQQRLCPQCLLRLGLDAGQDQPLKQQEQSPMEGLLGHGKKIRKAGDPQGEKESEASGEESSDD